MPRTWLRFALAVMRDEPPSSTLSGGLFYRGLGRA